MPDALVVIMCLNVPIYAKKINNLLMAWNAVYDCRVDLCSYHYVCSERLCHALAVWIHFNMYVYMYVCMYVCTYVCMYVCICMYI